MINFKKLGAFSVVILAVMALFAGKSPAERNKTIVAIVLGVLAISALYMAFGPSFTKSNASPRVTVTTSPSPTPSPGPAIPNRASAKPVTARCCAPSSASRSAWPPPLRSGTAWKPGSARIFRRKPCWPPISTRCAPWACHARNSPMPVRSAN